MNQAHSAHLSSCLVSSCLALARTFQPFSVGCLQKRFQASRILMTWKLGLLPLAILSFVGCVAPDLDRSVVNDPLMQVQQAGPAQGISPFTGMKNRARSGGGSCSACAR